MFPRQFAGMGVAVILAGAALGTRAETVSTNDSPFLPVGDAAAGAGAAAAPTYELAGASATGDGTQVCIYNAQTKRSAWIAVGATRDGVKVLSFDPDRDLAVVSANGERKVLTLRKAAVTEGPVPTFTPAVSPVVDAAPPPGMANGTAGQPPPGPTDAKTLKDERDAREARMLISDLMEIGMQQRKAYAEAKARAAAQAAANGQ